MGIVVPVVLIATTAWGVTYAAVIASVESAATTTADAAIIAALLSFFSSVVTASIAAWVALKRSEHPQSDAQQQRIDSLNRQVAEERRGKIEAEERASELESQIHDYLDSSPDG